MYRYQPAIMNKYVSIKVSSNHRYANLWFKQPSL